MFKRIGGWIWYCALPFLIVVVWKLAEVAGYTTPYTMPAPEEVVLTAIEFIADGTLWEHTEASFLRVIEGFVIALVLALSFGVAIGLNHRFERFTDAVLQIVKPIPPIAWIPLAILWFGIGEASKIYIIAVGAFFPILVNTIEGIKNIDPRYLELSRVYEAPKLRVILRVIVPGALPFIMTGVRLGLGMAWICVVAAELIAANSGIGYMLMDGRSLSRPDMVILGMVMIGIVGKLMDDLLRLISRRIIRWN
ncbi:ABC transporter permease [Campylobacterota bacterium]|nr:ABC transporter permease [Campylobacterota bacterium]